MRRHRLKRHVCARERAAQLEFQRSKKDFHVLESLTILGRGKTTSGDESSLVCEIEAIFQKIEARATI
jgi:hypothetical protein